MLGYLDPRTRGAATRVLLQSTCPAPFGSRRADSWRPFADWDEWLHAALSPSTWHATSVLLGRAPREALERCLAKAPADASWRRVCVSALHHGRSDVVCTLMGHPSKRVRRDALEGFVRGAVAAPATRRTAMGVLTAPEQCTVDRVIRLIECAAALEAEPKTVAFIVGVMDACAVLGAFTRLVLRGHRHWSELMGRYASTMLGVLAGRGMLDAMDCTQWAATQVGRLLVYRGVGGVDNLNTIRVWAQGSDMFPDVVEASMEEAMRASKHAEADWPPETYTAIRGWIDECPAVRGSLSFRLREFWKNIVRTEDVLDSL